MYVSLFQYQLRSSPVSVLQAPPWGPDAGPSPILTSVGFQILAMLSQRVFVRRDKRKTVLVAVNVQTFNIRVCITTLTVEKSENAYKQYKYLISHNFATWR